MQIVCHQGAEMPLGVRLFVDRVTAIGIHHEGKRLVERDLLKVEMVDGNKRDKMVSITEKGQELRTLAAQQIREIENSCAEIIGEDGKETLRALLSQLLKANDK